MITTARRSSTPEGIDLGHPVLSFVTALLLIVLLLLGIQQAGIVTPRFGRMNSSAGGDTSDGRTWTSVDLHNAGLLPIRVTALSWPTRNVTEPFLVVGDPGVPLYTPAPDVSSIGAIPNGHPFSPFTLEAGEHRTVAVGGRLACAGSLLTDELQVTVRTPLGLQRTVTLAAPQPLDGCE